MAALKHRPVPWRAVLAVCLLAARGSGAATPAAPAGTGAQRSASGRFSAYGPDPLWNLRWLIAAENTAANFERFFGRPVPHEPGFPIRIFADSSPLEPPSVFLKTSLTGGVLDQRIIVRHPDRQAPGVLSDLLAESLLARYVSFPKPADSIRLPAWWVAGLSEFSGNTDRATLYRTVFDAWTAGTLPPLARVVSWERAVPGEAPARAVCAALVCWIQAQPEGPVLAGRLLAGLQEGGEGLVPLRAAWPQLGETDREAEMRWNLWAASLGGRAPGPPRDPVEAAGSLLERLGVSREIAGAESRAGLPERVTPATLLEHRDEEWVAPAAVRMARSVSYLPVIELPPALRELRSGYIRWLGRLADPERRESRSEGRALRLELEQLDAGLRTHLEWSLDRKAFLDGVEAERESARLRAETERTGELRSGIREFLDQLESTLFFSIGEERPGR